jgi:hypothetical protein
VAVLALVVGIVLWKLLPSSSFEKFSAPPSEVTAGSVAKAGSSVDPAMIAGGARGESGPAEPPFEDWLVQEASTMDQARVDGPAKQAAIAERAKRMSKDEARVLLETARDPRRPAAQKILATYMLVESGLNARAELKDLIRAPLVEPKDAPPHSEAELRAMGEKSLRVMAIDSLFARARLDGDARQSLEQLVREIQDPQLRQLAERRMREISQNL